MRPIKMLVVNEFIAPQQAIASIRWTKLSKYLKKNHNVHIIVLTNKKYYTDDGKHERVYKDSLLEKEVVFFDEYIEVDYSPIVDLFWRFKTFVKNRFTSNAAYSDAPTASLSEKRYKDDTVLTLFKIYDDIVNFFKAKSILKVAKKTVADYDVIISSYGPVWTHLVAENLKKKNKKAFWIADFRDPYAKDVDSPFNFRRHKNFTKRHCSKADLITQVIDDMPLYLSENQTVVTITNGYDPEEALPPVPPDIFRLVLTGMIYEGRQNLSEIFHALKELIEEGKINKDNVIVEYAGNHCYVLKGQAKKWGMDDIIKDRGMLPRSEALKLQQNAAVLMQSGWNVGEEKNLWSGKSYEYMMAKKPIVYMMSGDIPNSMPMRYISRLGGVCYEEASHEKTYPELKKYILKKYIEWKETGNVTIDADEEYVSQFAYPVIAEKVWDLFPKNTK